MSQEGTSIDNAITPVTSAVNSKSGNNNTNSEAIVEDSNEITFVKKSVPKQRTQSVQSVLSSVSLKSFVQNQNQNQNNNINNKKAFVAPQPTPQQFINAKTHIQAPATAASSKRRASFEIGQRLPFNKELLNTDKIESTAIDIESDGEVEVYAENKKLTEDALKRLSSFSKFTPAEFDLSIAHKQVEDDHLQHPQPPQSQISSSHMKADDPRELKSMSSTNLNLNLPQQLPRVSSVLSSSRKPPSLKRNPSNLAPVLQHEEEDEHDYFTTKHNTNNNTNNTTPSPSAPSISHIENIQFQNNPQPKLLSQTTSSQSLDTQPLSKQHLDNTNLKTINDPKRPMYIPAVLRQSNTNLKPEDLRHINEQNSRRSKNNTITDAAHSLRSQTSHWRLSFETSHNGPTRAHWRRDISRNSCAFCEKSFTFFERRHHCRRCGDIYCAEHTSHLLKLGQDAQFTFGGSGVLCKVCDNCCKDYEDFVKSKFGDPNGSANIIKKPTNGILMQSSKQSNNSETNALVGSVPADWSWSSF